MTDFTADFVHHQPNTVPRRDTVRLPAAKTTRVNLRDATGRWTRAGILTQASTDEVSTRNGSVADRDARQNMPVRRPPSTSSSTPRWSADSNAGSPDSGASTVAGLIGDLNAWLKTAGRQGERLIDLVNTSDSDLWSCA